MKDWDELTQEEKIESLKKDVTRLSGLVEMLQRSIGHQSMSTESLLRKITDRIDDMDSRISEVEKK